MNFMTMAAMFGGKSKEGVSSFVGSRNRLFPSNSSNYSFSYPTNTQIGDLIVLFLACQTSRRQAHPFHQTWELVSGDYGFGIYCRRAHANHSGLGVDSGLNSSLVDTFNTAVVGIMVAIRNAQIVRQIAMSSLPTSGAGQPIAPLLSGVKDDGLVLAVGMNCSTAGSAPSFSAPSGYTARPEEKSGSLGLFVTYKESPGSSENPGALGTSVSAPFAVTIEVR